MTPGVSSISRFLSTFTQRIDVVCPGFWAAFEAFRLASLLMMVDFHGIWEP